MTPSEHCQPTTATIVIGCGATKLTHRAPARLLYTGSLFTMARRAADADGRPWVVLSGLHGFLTPDEVVAPYDRAVTTTADRHHLVQAIQATAHKVTQPLEAWCPPKYIAALLAAGMRVTATPLAGLDIGYQRRWLGAHARVNTPSLWSIT